MTDDQLTIFDALVDLDPTVVHTMAPEPAWVWARCPACLEVRYIRRSGLTSARCSMTAHCRARMEVYLEMVCAACGKPVTARRREADTRYCSKRCEDVSC